MSAQKSFNSEGFVAPCQCCEALRIENNRGDYHLI